MGWIGSLNSESAVAPRSDSLAPSDGERDRERIFPSQRWHMEPLNREGPPRPRGGGEGRGEGARFMGRGLCHCITTA